MLYEICTGEPPYRGDTPYAIMAQHVNNTPPPPSQRNQHISKALDAVILRSLARDPQARFPSASAMTVALAEAFEVPVPDQVRQAALSAQGRAGGRVGNPSSQPGTPARGLSLSGIPDVVETLPVSDSSATDMATQAGYVMGGHVDPTTQTLEPGVGEICDSITLLASFEVKAYSA
jgi:eukaryotic-like serine/threonine-protein kinase